ncbi:MAG: hypothetical protein V4591_06605, partial [Bdellovibrionota bacterium]
MKKHLLFLNIFSVLCSFVTGQQAFSKSLIDWTNPVTFVNEFDVPMVLTISPTDSSVTSRCGHGITEVVVPAHSSSCVFEFKTKSKNIFDMPHNKGSILFSVQNDPDSSCTLNYSYKYDAVSFFKSHSQNFSSLVCGPNSKQLSAKEVVIENSRSQALVRPLSGSSMKLAQSTESFSRADCHGGTNCIIVAPDFNTTYHYSDGSSLEQSLALQRQLGQYESLNFMQFLGTHNSIISDKYTTSNSDYNMSHGDPNQYLSVTEQLNSGIRQLEYDLLWDNNNLRICHNHVSSLLKPVLCADNENLSKPIDELKIWVAAHPNEFVLLFLDVNEELGNHSNNLNEALATLDPYVLKSSDLGVPNTAFPANSLSAYDVIHKYKKNIVVTMQTPEEGLKDSPYIFGGFAGSSSKSLPQSGVGRYLDADKNSFPTKYDFLQSLMTGDMGHNNIWRLLGNRTVARYVAKVGDSSPGDIQEAITAEVIRQSLAYPINIYSMDMFGFTCGTSSCDTHPT